MALNFENVGLTEIIPGLTKSGGVDESIQLDSAITNGVGGQPLFAAFGDESKASTGSAVSAAVKRKVSITLSGNVTSATSLTFTGGADTTAVTIAAEDTPSEVADKVVTAVNADSGALVTASNSGPVLLFEFDAAGAAANSATVSIAVTDATLSAGAAVEVTAGADAVTRSFIGILANNIVNGTAEVGDHMSYRRHGLVAVSVVDAVSAWKPAYLDGNDKLTATSSGNTAIDGVFRSNAEAGGTAWLELK